MDTLSWIEMIMPIISLVSVSSVRFGRYLIIGLLLLVSKVMKTDLHCLPVSGATVRDIGEFKTVC